MPRLERIGSLRCTWYRRTLAPVSYKAKLGIETKECGDSADTYPDLTVWVPMYGKSKLLYAVDYVMGVECCEKAR